MLRCKDVAHQANTLIDGDLSPATAFRMRLHLAMCRHCRRLVAQLRLTRALCEEVARSTGAPPAPATADDLPPALRARLRTRNAGRHGPPDTEQGP